MDVNINELNFSLRTEGRIEKIIKGRSKGKGVRKIFTQRVVKKCSKEVMITKPGEGENFLERLI